MPTWRQVVPWLALRMAAADSSLAEGLTFAWTTPILRVQIEPEESESLSIVADAVADAWHAHTANATLATSARTVSDSFFAAQRDAFHAGGSHLLATLDGAAGVAVRGWHAAWQSQILRYVEAAGGPNAARALTERHARLALFAWGGLHEGCSRHASHFHPDAAVSGVFYLRVPAASADAGGGGGAFVADDPRGPRPPFENRLRHQPRAGELLLFPPWLRHSVEPAAGSCAMRRRPRTMWY